MSLNPCAQCKSPAVEQVRGKMGPGDYKEVQKIDHKGHYVDDVDFYKIVHLDPSIEKDVRISCSKCDNATGWNQPDAPGMPGIGLDFIRKAWNEKNSP